MGAGMRRCDGSAGSGLAGMWGESAGMGIGGLYRYCQVQCGDGQGKGSGGLRGVAVPGGFELGAGLAAWGGCGKAVLPCLSGRICKRAHSRSANKQCQISRGGWRWRRRA